MVHYHVCGAKITYETSLPRACPKCGAALKDPLKTVALATAAAVKVASQVQTSKASAATAEVDDDIAAEDISPRPIARGSRSIPVSSLRKPQPTRRTAVARLAEEDDLDNETEEGLEGSDDTDEGYDTAPANPREVRRLARELAASIDPATIHVGNADEGPVTFADWCGRPKGGR